jgi:hypothetical protein
MNIVNKLLLSSVLVLSVYTPAYAITTENSTSNMQASPLAAGQATIIQDKNLEKAIAEYLHKPAGSNITKADLSILNSLILDSDQSKDVTSLSGLEYATNLTYFAMFDSKVTDYSPLETLTNLRGVDLRGDNITVQNFPDFTKLPKLTSLAVSYAQLDNTILPKIAQLTQLEQINLDGHPKITTIEPLKVLPNLQALSIQFCGVRNFRVIKEFPMLNDLSAYGQTISSPTTTVENTHFPYDEAQQSLFIYFTLMPDILINFTGAVVPFNTSVTATNLSLNSISIPANRLQITDRGITVSGVSKQDYENLTTLSYTGVFDSSQVFPDKPNNYVNYAINASTYYHEFTIVKPPAYNSTITVKHVNEVGQEIAPAEMLKGKTGEPYKAEPKNLADWTLKETPADAEGYFSEIDWEVIFVYEKAQSAPVTVRYLDENGTALTEDIVLSGEIGDSFTAEPKQFPSWRLKEVPVNSQGNFTSSPQTVTFIYEKAQGAPVTVHYLDENGTALTEDTVLSGKIGDSFTAEPKQFPSWRLKEVPVNSQGNFTSSPQTVTFIYEKAQGAPVTVHYLDEFGNQLAEPLILEGKIGEPYQAEAKLLNSWLLKKIPSNAQGVFTEEPQQIAFTYELKEAANDLPITPENMLTTKKEANRLTDLAEPALQRATTHSTTAQEANSLLPQTSLQRHLIPEVTSTHEQKQSKKDDTGTVTVKFLDEKGREIAAPATFKGKIGERYKLAIKNNQAKLERQ